MKNLRNEIAAAIKIALPDDSAYEPYTVLESVKEEGYTRQRIEYRMKNDIGIEMASVIPNFHGNYDIYDLVSCIAPRRLLIVSAEEDQYSKDAPFIIEKAKPAYAMQNALKNLEHKRYPGGHALTKERFDFILEWLDLTAKRDLL